ncbi:helix-turn-helix domain-containing protein [Frankia sp. AiPa1]|uniref:AraC family transcriptional regulator n=1 Tax=Frankia sp. AiPa1 TaxID=573492 RepID=UPI00202BA49C|nr:helix-turn-helix domain-containing protein [Frankia sp. AiPa1]MCL9758750.1 helix-turn-helix domain-containing protein [Frankia sp. AiPa1]
MNDDSERIIPLPVGLRPWISQLSVAASGGEPAHPVRAEAPDATTALVVRATSDRTELVVMGPRTRAEYFEVSRVPFCVKMRMQLGRAQSLLGVPLSGLVDRVVPIGDLWGVTGDRLVDDLSNVESDPTAVVGLLAATLMDRVRTRSRHDLARDELVRSATLALTSLTSPGPRVQPTARRLKVSERHLRSLFTDAVGIPPKHVARIARTRHVLAGASHQSLARLAAEAGYYDQSHMTAEFRRMMGTSPRAFVAGQLPAAAPCH